MALCARNGKVRQASWKQACLEGIKTDGAPLYYHSKLHNDIVILEEVVKDNIDEGKSIEYFKWMTRSLPDPKPQFGELGIVLSDRWLRRGVLKALRCLISPLSQS